MNVLIVGRGVVGEATAAVMEREGHTVFYHDPPKGIDFESLSGVEDEEGLSLGGAAYRAAAEYAEASRSTRLAILSTRSELAGTTLHDMGCVLICIPTPLGKYGLDDEAVREAAKWLDSNKYDGLAGIRSTVQPGTCDYIIDQYYYNATWFSWPEFLQAKTARRDALDPYWEVIGIHEVTSDFIDKFLPNHYQTMPGFKLCLPKEAEFIKLAANAIHATSVSVANELSEIADELDLNWNSLLPPMAPHSRFIPDNIWVTKEGGFGGACLPKDLGGVMRLVSYYKTNAPVLSSVDSANRIRRPDAYEGEKS